MTGCKVNSQQNRPSRFNSINIIMYTLTNAVDFIDCHFYEFIVGMILYRIPQKSHLQYPRTLGLSSSYITIYLNFNTIMGIRNPKLKLSISLCTRCIPECHQSLAFFIRYLPLASALRLPPSILVHQRLIGLLGINQ